MGDTAPERNEPGRAAQMMGLGQLAMRSERDGPAHIISLFGELDRATAPDVERELERVEAADARSIVLDLSGLTFIDSTGIHLILNAEARSRADSCGLTLLRGPDSVQRVFALAGVEDRLSFAD